MVKWQSIKRDDGTLYFKQHETRKHGVKFDRYYRSGYMYQGRRVALNFGWLSEGWSESACLQKLKYFKDNAKAGKRPINFKQERELQKQEEQDRRQEEQDQIKEKITLSEFFSSVYYPLIQTQKKEQEYRREKSLFNKWIDPVMGGIELKNIKRNDVDNAYHSVTKEGLSVRTGDYVLTVLKQVYREAIEREIVTKFPGVSNGVKNEINRTDNSRTRFLSYKEADLLLTELKKISEKVYEQAIISLHCGLRASEILGLSWSNIDIEHQLLNLKNTKSGKNRSVKMTDSVKQLFDQKTKGKANELIFPGRENKRANVISSTFKRVSDKLFNEGVTDPRERVVFHTCRHTCASWMVAAGVSLYLVQKVLGHSTIQVTERYSHLAPDQLQIAADAINKAFNDPTNKS